MSTPGGAARRLRRFRSLCACPCGELHPASRGVSSEHVPARKQLSSEVNSSAWRPTADNSSSRVDSAAVSAHGTSSAERNSNCADSGSTGSVTVSDDIITSVIFIDHTTLGTLAKGHWGTSPVNFQQFIFFSSLSNYTESDSDFLRLTLLKISHSVTAVAACIHFVSFLCDELPSFRRSFVPPSVTSDPCDATVRTNLILPCS